MKYVWLIYLQFLFVIGQFNAKKNWIDKHILMCYNKLDELNVNYVKYHDFDKKNMSNFMIESLKRNKVKTPSQGLSTITNFGQLFIEETDNGRQLFFDKNENLSTQIWTFF